jgi:predicted  nucleic acid-binding Zn-ribbon protein
MDYAVSPEGIKAAAQEEYDQLQGEIDAATERQAELEAEHDLDPSERGVG